MQTYKQNDEFKLNTLKRLGRKSKFKLCNNIAIGALVEMSQIHLDGGDCQAAWLTEDVEYIIFGDNLKCFVFTKDKLIKISTTKKIKDYPKTKTKGFHLTLNELNENCLFSF